MGASEGVAAAGSFLCIGIQRLPAASRTVYATCDTFSNGFEILVIDYAELVSDLEG